MSGLLRADSWGEASQDTPIPTLQVGAAGARIPPPTPPGNYAPVALSHLLCRSWGSWRRRGMLCLSRRTASQGFCTAGDRGKCGRDLPWPSRGSAHQLDLPRFHQRPTPAACQVACKPWLTSASAAPPPLATRSACRPAPLPPLETRSAPGSNTSLPLDHGPKMPTVVADSLSYSQ